MSSLEKILKNLPPSKKIGYTFGAWDLLHPGHIHFLTRASELGDFLIVGIVADKPIKDLKGKDRPIQSQEDRMIVVGSLKCVDAVISQTEYDPSDELDSLPRVDILTKGDDWDYIPGTEKIEELGGHLIKLRYTTKYSTSKMVSKIHKSKGL